MAYNKVGWKNWPLKLTMISAENLDHMDEQIKVNADNIGDIEKISEIGDGTLADAMAVIKEQVDKQNSDKQDKQWKCLQPGTVAGNTLIPLPSEIFENANEFEVFISKNYLLIPIRISKVVINDSTNFIGGGWYFDTSQNFVGEVGFSTNGFSLAKVIYDSTIITESANLTVYYR